MPRWRIDIIGKKLQRTGTVDDVCGQLHNS
jgi:hypothetical protein